MYKKLILAGSLLLFTFIPFRSEARDYLQDIEKRQVIQSIIVAEALAFGVDPGLGIFLASVESDFNSNARSKESTASGVFQWIKGSWMGICVKGYKIGDEHEDVFDATLNIRCAMKTIANGGLRHWLADHRTKKKLIDAGFVKEQVAYGN